jgi:hypothetical protein
MENAFEFLLGTSRIYRTATYNYRINSQELRNFLSKDLSGVPVEFQALGVGQRGTVHRRQLRSIDNLHINNDKRQGR